MPIKLSQKQIIIIGAGILLVVIVFVLIFLNTRPRTSNGPLGALTMWGTEDTAAITAITSVYPYARVSYVRVDAANYKENVLAALAAGTGPDVFEIGNRDLAQWRAVLAPFPTSSAQIGLIQLRQLFPDVVAQDFVSHGQIYGLPLSIDTLAMFYNKDIFNTAGIAILPATWDDLAADVARLRIVNGQGQLVRAAAAIGGSRASIPNAPDLLSLLMLQNGVQMTNDTMAYATFASQDANKGLGAFNFYLQFANAASPYYAWNDAMGDEITSFVNGKTAIMFGYQADLAAVEAKAPFLNIGIAPMPQAKGATVAVNYPSYAGFVAAKAGQSAVAQNLILYLTTFPGNGKIYQNARGVPPALRADVAADANNEKLSVFASQILTARSWYEADAASIDTIFDTAIKNVLHGTEDAPRALTEAERAVTQLISHSQ